MSLFQKSVLNSIEQDESLVDLRWATFQNYSAKTVKEIDAMVYGLNEGEIAIVEGNSIG